MREWANLYNTPETKQLALDIFKYNYTSGYAFRISLCTLEGL